MRSSISDEITAARSEHLAENAGAFLRILLRLCLFLLRNSFRHDHFFLFCLPLFRDRSDRQKDHCMFSACRGDSGNRFRDLRRLDHFLFILFRSLRGFCFRSGF